MKVLLARDVMKLGHVGDVVKVKDGYARNYLLPYGLAVEPTDANLKALEEAKQIAAAERARRRQELEAEAVRLQGVEVTIAAAANQDGHLYGSVSAKEIAEALIAEGYAVNADQVRLDEPIRQLDTFTVSIVLAQDVRTEIKVWVVRDKQEPDADEDHDDGQTGDTSDDQ